MPDDYQPDLFSAREIWVFTVKTFQLAPRGWLFFSTARRCELGERSQRKPISPLKRTIGLILIIYRFSASQNLNCVARSRALFCPHRLYISCYLLRLFFRLKCWIIFQPSRKWFSVKWEILIAHSGDEIGRNLRLTTRNVNVSDKFGLLTFAGFKKLLQTNITAKSREDKFDLLNADRCY